jgi:hypothetical protein
MAAAALIAEPIFDVLSLVPEQRHPHVAEASTHSNCTIRINITFLALGALLVWRFLGTGGREMLG